MTSLTLEQVLVHPRFKLSAAVLGVAVFLSTVGFLVAANRIPHTVSTAAVSALPEKPYDIPILYQLPAPEPMIAKAGKLTETAHARARWVSARR